MSGAARAGASWWTRRRIAIASVAAALVGIASFIFRFNTLGGALGGFDNDHFIYLTRTDMLLWGEQPLRDFVDAELRGAWPAMSYLASAWAQQIGGRTLLPEAYLCAGALAVASALVFLLALDLSKQWTIAALAAAVTVAMVPKLYNYPKVLGLTLGVWALRAVVASPSRVRLAIVAFVTVVAALFRHDLGLYVGAATVVALVLRDPRPRILTLRHLGIYVGWTLVFLLPSLAWIQIYEGLPSYVQNSLASVTAEQSRTQLTLPRLDLAMPFSEDNLLLATYYAFWAVPVLAAGVLVARLASGSSRTPAGRALLGGLLTMGILANESFLRANLAARFGDSVAPIVLLVACSVGAASIWRSLMLRRAVTTVATVLLAQMLVAAYSFSDIALELDTSGLSDSWGKIERRYAAVRTELSALPPTVWSSNVPGADTAAMQAAGYIARCTRPDDRLLVTGPIHEVPVLARRRFAAGQAMYKLSLYTSERDEQRALARLQGQSVPIILSDAREYGEGFLEDYPLLAAHLEQHYRNAGSIDVDDEPGFVVFVEKDRPPTGEDDELRLPCFR
jgi:hypothetical protein